MEPLAAVEFRWLWLAVFAANSGLFAIVLVGGAVAYRVSGGSPLWSSSVFTAVLAPTILVGPAAGALADRFSRPRLVSAGLATSLVACVAATVAMAIAGAGQVSLAALLACCLVAGAGRAVISPAWQALLPGILGLPRLLGGGALMRVGTQGGELVGPAFTAGLVAAGLPAAAFGVCAALYALALAFSVALWRLSGRPVARAAGRPGLLRPAVEGLRYAVRTPPLGAVLGLVGLHCALTMAFLGLLPGLATGRLHDGQLYGVLVTAVGLGAIGGALGLAVLAWRADVTRVFVVSAAASGGTLAWLGASAGAVSALAAAVAAGAAQAVFMTGAYTLTQTLVADRMRGRVASFSGILTAGSMSLVSLVWGALADVTSPAVTMVATGTAFVVATIAYLVWMPSLRRRRGLTRDGVAGGPAQLPGAVRAAEGHPGG